MTGVHGLDYWYVLFPYDPRRTRHTLSTTYLLVFFTEISSLHLRPIRGRD